MENNQIGCRCPRCREVLFYATDDRRNIKICRNCQTVWKIEELAWGYFKLYNMSITDFSHEPGFVRT